MQFFVRRDFRIWLRRAEVADPTANFTKITRMYNSIFPLGDLLTGTRVLSTVWLLPRRFRPEDLFEWSSWSECEISRTKVNINWPAISSVKICPRPSVLSEQAVIHWSKFEWRSRRFFETPRHQPPERMLCLDCWIDAVPKTATNAKKCLSLVNGYLVESAQWTSGMSHKPGTAYSFRGTRVSESGCIIIYIVFCLQLARREQSMTNCYNRSS